MQKIVKQRNSNLELYRIIVMMLIVAHHSVYHSGVMEDMAQNSLNMKSVFYYILGMWGRTGIDCFVLITGYFMCKSHITVQKYLKLFLEVIFYNVMIYAIFMFFGKLNFSVTGLFFSVFPFQEIDGLFVPCFLLFYLFIPYLSILVSHIDKLMHARLVLLCLAIYSLTITLPHFQVAMNHITWYCVLFFIASYIRNYGLLPSISNQKWGGITLLCVILSILSVLCVVYFDARLGKQTPPFKYVSPSGICAVLTSVSSFMYFKDLKMRNSRFVNRVAASTFGVLLIHDNCLAMRQWLWHELMPVKSIYALDSINSIVTILIVILGIFVACILLDMLRKNMIEKPLFEKINNYL